MAAAVAVTVLVVSATSGGSGHHSQREAAGRTATKARPSPTPTPTASGFPLNTALFAPGACVAFGPTAGNRHLTVFLDAGHGGIDPGAVGTTEAGTSITEASLNLPIELDTMAILRSEGLRVVVSRTRASTVKALTAADVSDNVLTLQGAFDDVAARAQCANLAGAAVLLGIYFDAGSTPQNAGAVTAYDTARPFAAANQRLAQMVQADVMSAMNARGWEIPSEGALPDTGLGSAVPTTVTGGLATEALNYHHLLLLGPAETGYFSTPSKMPGAVLEPLFITDPFEGSIAASELGQQTIAGAMARAVLQYLAPPRVTPTASVTTAS